MLDVSAAEFKASRDRQEQVAREIRDDYVRRLLLFYAVECGGKYQLLKDRRVHVFSKLPEADKEYKHDLMAILKSIGLEQKCLRFPHLHSVHKGETIDVEKYHEMWRYGIRCKEYDGTGQDIEDTLGQALRLLHENENRR